MGFLTLLACFWFVARYFHVPVDAWTGVSFALLLAPYWAFGFGLENRLHDRARGAVAMIAYLAAAYLVFAFPERQFRWDMFVGMIGIVAVVFLLLAFADPASPDWRDWLVLIILGISVDLHLFDHAWTVPGLTGMPKLLFVDAGLYGYLVLRPIGGVGFDFRPQRADLAIGIREFLLYAPIAILLGFALDFLHLHRVAGGPWQFAAGWLFTLFFVAMPEELFFRGLILNMLARRIGSTRALIVTSVLFGLAHFNKRAAHFNWRYVILAAIAGVFYGRAWLARRRLLASSITHATVDTVWSIWLR